MGTNITLDRLGKRGYEAMLTHYEKIALHLNEPLYTNCEALTNSKKEDNIRMSKPVSAVV